MAKDVGDPAAEQQEAAIAEHIGADSPLQRCRLHAEFGLDGGKRNADGGDVHGVEKIGGAEQQQCQPRPAWRFGKSHRNRSFFAAASSGEVAGRQGTRKCTASFPIAN